MVQRNVSSEEESLGGASQRRASALELALAVASLEQRHAEADQTQEGLLHSGEATECSPSLCARREAF